MTCPCEMAEQLDPECSLHGRDIHELSRIWDSLADIYRHISEQDQTILELKEQLAAAKKTHQGATA